VSGIKAIQQIEGVMDKEAPIVYLAGEPGSGKTNFALLLAQIWSRIQERESRSYQLASNIRTWEEQDDWIERFSRLEEWATEYVEDLPDGGSTLRDGAPRKLYIFDEASSHAMGIGEQGYQTAMLLGPLVKKIRKGNAGLIIIGHDGKDVAPAVRVLATFVRRYVENKKRATLYRNIRNRQGEDKIVDVSGVPVTDFSYDDKEATRFVWDLDGDLDDEVLDAAADLAEDAIEDDRRRVAAQLYLNDSLDASQTDIARAMGDYSQSWVSRAVDAYQNGELSTDGEGMAVS
jgi:energy-coupling factor transporter ATP-binding protein EcfA2